MYTKYFGFNEKPFTLTPNPRFIYLSKHHKEAFAHLLYGINNHYGFIELIGEVGTGKTTVLRTLLTQLQEDNYRTALIVNPCLTGVELLRSICHEFGLNSKSEHANELLIDINKFLLQEASEGRTVVLVIDESQNLQPNVLEQIRLISNLETENDKLIQIILAGQPELGIMLERQELRQLNQRIAVRYRLNSMSMPETRAYIRHRMEVAGETGGVSFSKLAIRLIYLYTNGVPRMINILCDRALLIGYGDEQRLITVGIVTRAIRELLTGTQVKRLSLAFFGVLSVLITGVILSANSGSWLPAQLNKIHKPATVVANANSTHTPTPAQESKTVAAAATLNSSGVSNQKTLQLQQEILSYDRNDFHISAFNAIAGKWGVNPINTFSGHFTVPKTYSHFAEKRNLKVTPFKGTLDEAIRFDVPFLVSIKAGDSQNGYCVAVTSIRNDALSISPPLFGSSTLSKNDLNSVASGTFYLVWQNIGLIPAKMKQGDKRYEVRALQTLLQKAGTYKGPIDSNYSIATTRAVTDFQQSAGIPRNETLGELTLAALTKYSGNQKVPSISSAGSSK